MGQEQVERRLAAILAADVVGYSRLVEANEESTLVALRQHRHEFFDPTVVKHGG
ncbi:MAG: adenylate/guanylate cyclase domain-containing protein, partial [Mesorhizobium sp.]